MKKQQTSVQESIKPHQPLVKISEDGMKLLKDEVKSEPPVWPPALLFWNALCKLKDEIKYRYQLILAKRNNEAGRKDEL